MKHKLLAVIRHEYLTIVRQPAFLLTLLAVPLLMGAVFAISYFASSAADSNIEERAEQISDVVIIDRSGVIEPSVAQSFDMELRSPEETDRTVQEVRDEELAGAIIYPEDLGETREFSVHMSGGDDPVMSSAISDVGENIISASLLAPFDENVSALIMEGASGDVTAYENGEETPGIAANIVPGIFMAIFFVVLFFSMGYMLLGVAEEKENRSMEMVLSYLHPRTLITGKLFGVSLVALTQLLFFTVLGVVGLLVARQYEDRLNLPLDVDFSSLVFDPLAVAIGLSVLVLGFLFFAAMMSGVASMTPGVKEANSFSGVFFIIPFVPFWSAGVIVTAPESALVTFMTYFPVTSPTTILFRNTLGNIGATEAAGAIAVLAVSTVLAFLLAAKLFRIGALEYADRVKLTSLFKK